MEFHLKNMMYTALSMRTQTEKTTFSCKDDFTFILEWGQGTCSLTKHTWRGAYSWYFFPACCPLRFAAFLSRCLACKAWYFPLINICLQKFQPRFAWGPLCPALGRGDFTFFSIIILAFWVFPWVTRTRKMVTFLSHFESTLIWHALQNRGEMKYQVKCTTFCLFTEIYAIVSYQTTLLLSWVTNSSQIRPHF